MAPAPETPCPDRDGLRSPLVGEGIDQDRESRRHHRGGADTCQASQRDGGCPAAPPARTPAMRQRTRLGRQPGTVDVPTGRLRSRSVAARPRRPGRRRSPPTSARSAWPWCSRRCPVARARGRTRHRSPERGPHTSSQHAVKSPRPAGGEVVTWHPQIQGVGLGDSNVRARVQRRARTRGAVLRCRSEPGSDSDWSAESVERDPH